MQQAKPVRWLLMLPMSLGAFCAALDNNILSVCLPSIIKEFHSDPGMGQFVSSSYTFAICGLLLTFGYFSSSFGRMRVFAIGTLTFATSSLLSVFGPNIAVLIALRIIQGVGAAMFMANGMALVNTHFGPEVRGRAFGILATAGAVASILGPIVGGFIASRWGWRVDFLLLVALGLTAAFTAIKLLAPEAIGNWRKTLSLFDYTGALLSILSVLLLVGSLFALRSHLWILFAALLVATAISGLVFIRQQMRSANPILHADVLTNKIFVNGNVMALIIFAIMMGISTTLPLYLASRNISTDTAGFLLSFQAIPIFAISFMAGWLADHYSARVVSLSGSAIVLAGVVVLAIAFPLNVIYMAAIGNAVLGIGIGFFNPSNQKIVMSSVDNRHASVAASTNVLFRNLGVATGTALAGIIFGVFEGLGNNSPISPGVGTLLFFIALAVILVLLGGIRGIKGSKPDVST